jgi:hypothetical protein
MYSKVPARTALTLGCPITSTSAARPMLFFKALNIYMFRETFSPTSQHLAMLRVVKQFIHLPMNSILCQLPELPRRSQYGEEIDVSESSLQLFTELQRYCGGIGDAVKPLNQFGVRIRRKRGWMNRLYLAATKFGANRGVWFGRKEQGN